MDGTESTNFSNASIERNNLDITERSIEAAILTGFAVTALVGNVSLWFIINLSKRLRTNSNAFILCLSGADILVSAVNMPVIVYTILAGDWKFSSAACTVLGFTTMLTFVASVMSLAAISFNRYIMICHPGKFRAIYTKRNTGLIICGVWLLSALLAIPPLVGWAKYDYLPGQSVCFCAWKTSVSYTFFMVFACFGGPCSSMTFCYISILREVHKSKKKVYSNSSVTGQAKPSVTSNPHHIAEAPSTSITDINDEKQINGVDNEQLSTISTYVDISYNQNQNKNNSNNEESQEETSTAAVSNSFKNENCSSLDRNGSYKKANSSAYDSFKDKPKRKNSKISSLTSPLKGIRNSKGNDAPLSDAQILKLRKREKRRQEELRLTTSFLIVIFCFILCWLPYCATMFWSVFSDSPVPRIPDMISLLLGCMNSCCNPIIYGAMNRNFREGFKRLYCDCFRIGCRTCLKAENSSTTIRSSTT